MKESSESCPLPDRSEDEKAARILKSARTIAVVGMSSKPSRPSREVGLYLRDHGYSIIPVHPREKEIAGIRVYRDLDSIPAEVRVDVVDLFVSGDRLMEIVEAASRRGAPVVWFQPGAENPAAASRARELGLEVVSGRCTMADHARLLRRR